MHVREVDGEWLEGKDLPRGGGEVIRGVVVEVTADTVHSAGEVAGDPDIHVQGAIPELGRE